jgi:hypothetical protein
MQQRLPLALPAKKITLLAIHLQLTDVPSDRQPFLRHTESGWLAATPKKFTLASERSGESFALANQLAGNSSVQSVMYFPPKTPRRSISGGGSSGRKSGSKLRPMGATRT